MKISEGQIQKVVMDYLSIKQNQKKLIFWRNNAGGIKTPKYFIRLGTEGSPDIFVLKDSKLIGLEIKTEKGKQRESQKLFQEKLEMNGGEYHIIRSVDEVIAIGL